MALDAIDLEMIRQADAIRRKNQMVGRSNHSGNTQKRTKKTALATRSNKDRWANWT